MKKKPSYLICYDTDGEMDCFHEPTQPCGCECHYQYNRDENQQKWFEDRTVGSVKKSLAFGYFYQAYIIPAILIEYVLLIISWLIWVIPIETETPEQWIVQLTEQDIPKNAAMTLPQQKLILIERELYPTDKAGCDILKHEYYHAQWHQISNGEGEDHMKLIKNGDFC